MLKNLNLCIRMVIPLKDMSLSNSQTFSFAPVLVHLKSKENDEIEYLENL